MKHSFLFLFIALSLVKTPCHAQEHPLYIKGLIGPNYLYVWERHVHLKSNPMGYYGGGSLGWSITRNWDVEIENLYRNSSVKVRIPESTLSAFKTGSAHGWSAMCNVIYNYGLCNCLPLNPYMGFGVGFSDTGGHLNAKRKNEFNSAFNRVYKYRYKLEKNGIYAYQGFIGVKWPLREQLELGVEARFMHEILRTLNFSFGLTLQRRL